MNIKNEKELYEYVLMERIMPFETDNYIVHRSNEIHKMRINSELGIFGITIWLDDNKLK